MSQYARMVLPLVLLHALSSELPAQARAPGASWPTALPAAVGLNPAVLDSISAEIKSGKYGHVDRFLVIRKGRIAFDESYPNDYGKIYADSAKVSSPLNPHDVTGMYNYYNSWWHPTYRRGDLHTLQSVTKTVTSVIIGVAQTYGYFGNLDTPVLSYFDTTRVANIDDRKRRMTLRHLLTMTDGIDWNENLAYTNPANSAIGLEASYDWVKFTIDRPMMREPGTVFNYNSGASELLAHIFHRETGRDIEEFAAATLFAPLGIERWFWKRTPSGLIDTEGGLYLEARDLARIWYLFARKGEWNGKQVVGRDWVQQSVTPAISAGPAGSPTKYGFKWWLYPDPVDPTKYVWSGSGFGGQAPMLFPDRDLIVVFNAWNILPGMPGIPGRLMRERLAKAVIGP